MNQLVLSNMQEEILASRIRYQKRMVEDLIQSLRESLNETLEAIERRDMTADEAKESLKLMEKRVAALRKIHKIALPTETSALN